MADPTQDTHFSDLEELLMDFGDHGDVRPRYDSSQAGMTHETRR